jgi:methylmalonyl-CoA mutase
LPISRSRLPREDERSAQPWLTPEGLLVKPSYSEADLNGIDFLDTWPGIAPFLRGPYPTMYVNQPWTVRQYAGFSTAEDSNAFYRRNLAAGQKGLSVAFDLATHRGYDRSSARLRRRRHGGCRHRFHLRHAHAVRRHSARPDERVDDHERRGAADPRTVCRRGRRTGRAAGETVRHHSERHSERVHGAQHLHLSASPSMRIISDIFAYTSQRMPKYNSISISGYHMQEAGATQDLELAYTLADGVEYLAPGWPRA